MRPGLLGSLGVDTPIGPCRVWWSGRGIVRVALPSRPGVAAVLPVSAAPGDVAAGDTAPPDVLDAARRIAGLLSGHADDLSSVVVDLTDRPAFDQAVYALCRAVLPGRTRTYGAIARDLGDVALSRRVGQALGRNPVPLVVPCHRVLGAHGSAGGFSAPGGLDTKLRLLAIEAAFGGDEPRLFADLPLAVDPARRTGGRA